MKRDDGAGVRDATALAVMVRRRECGLTQLQLAKRAGLSQANVSRIELGLSSLTIEHFCVIARVLRLTRLELWARIEKAMRNLRHPATKKMFREGRVRVRAPRLRE